MRNHCCAVDPSDPACTADCTVPTTGRCVEKPDCLDEKYFFNEFSGKCEFKYPCEPFWYWSERSRKCETHNGCDQGSDARV